MRNITMPLARLYIQLQPGHLVHKAKTRFVGYCSTIVETTSAIELNNTSGEAVILSYLCGGMFGQVAPCQDYKF